MQLEEIFISGFRSMRDVGPIPLGTPTILTGPNDAGKTAIIKALSFLLGEYAILPTDVTVLRDMPEHDTLHVNGVFRLNEEEGREFALAENVHIRRVWERGGGAKGKLELETEAPAEERLRQLSSTLPLAELRTRAEDLGVTPEGPEGRKASYLAPLQVLAAAAERVTTWVPVSRRMEELLPRFLEFSSTDEPDAVGDIRVSLQAVFQTMVDDPKVVGRVRQVQEKLQANLQKKARALEQHLAHRCPDLPEMKLQPKVSFRSGFEGVDLVEKTGLGWREAGSGRRRRMTLAVWEWTGGVLRSGGAKERELIIAYDEPDVHLDYQRQRDFMNLVRDQVKIGRTRIVVATHSLNLIDRVDIEDVVLVRQASDGLTEIHRPQSGSHEHIGAHLGAIANEMGLRTSVLLHERCFVAVEGLTEQQSLPILFRVATGLSMQACGVALIVGNNNDGALRVLRYLAKNGRPVHCIIDADSSKSELRSSLRPEALAASGLSGEQIHLVGNPDSLEDLFPDARWAKVANAEWKRNDGRTWRPAEFAILRGGDVTFSKALESMVRPASDSAPQSKPGYVLALARTLTKPRDVPEQLRDVFSQLMTATR